MRALRVSASRPCNEINFIFRPSPDDDHRTAQTDSIHGGGAADLHRSRIGFLIRNARICR